MKFLFARRRKGLDNSSRIRQLLIQNMRFFLANEFPKPSDEDLRIFFEANRDRFELQPSITYEHVFFVDPENIPAGTLDQLLSGIDHTKAGDANSFGSLLIKMDQRMIAKSFGPEEASGILAISDKKWYGPFISPRGAHFLRISAHHAAEQAEFEGIKSWVEASWNFSKTREIIDQELVELRKGYRIEILHSGGMDQ